MTIGKRLREERERLGMSQPAFAAIAETTKQTLFSWETGKTAPDGFQLAALAAVNADVMYILTGQRSQPATDAAEQILLESYRRCSQQAKQNLIQTAALLSAGLHESQKAQSGTTINTVGRDSNSIQGDGNLQISGDVETGKGASQKFFGSVGNVAGRDINMQTRKRTRDKP